MKVGKNRASFIVHIDPMPAHVTKPQMRRHIRRTLIGWEKLKDPPIELYYGGVKVIYAPMLKN